MVRVVTFICLLTAAGSCIPEESPKGLPGHAEKPDVLTVFLTGNELGALRPCGCAGGQLGGLDRRLAIFKSVPASKRLIVDTGSLVEGTSEQDQIKFEIIVQAFRLLGYDLVNLTEEDIELARNRGLLDGLCLLLNVISPQGLTDPSGPAGLAKRSFTKRFLLEGKAVGVTVAAFDAQSDGIEQVRELFLPDPGLEAVNILIMNRCDDDIIGTLKQTGSVDCLVCPSESDEAMLISDPTERPLVISLGRYGKYVGKLEIRSADPGRAHDKLHLSFAPVDVNENLPLEGSLVALYKDYQQLVKDADLLEKQPRWPLPDGLEYRGSKSCKPCHEYEYEKWSSKAHAHAYATLERDRSQYDPECVVCHVVGGDYESGFVSEAKSSEDLKNVGCENCHGPGSEHIESWGVTATRGPKSKCVDCHTPENSVNYAGNEELYLKKIIHWREPNSADNVKEKGQGKD